MSEEEKNPRKADPNRKSKDEKYAGYLPIEGRPYMLAEAGGHDFLVQGASGGVYKVTEKLLLRMQYCGVIGLLCLDLSPGWVLVSSF